MPGEEKGLQEPWVFAGDGIPPNGAELIGSGNRFPEQAAEGDWYLRTDYSPHGLFKRLDGRWRMMEQNYREGSIKSAHGILLSFINNKNITSVPNVGDVPEKQMVSKIAKKPSSDL